MILKPLKYLVQAGFFLPCLFFASSSWSSEKLSIEQLTSVGQILAGPDGARVLIEYGSLHGLTAGSIYETTRQKGAVSNLSSNRNSMIVTGEIKLSEVYKNWSTGIVLKESTEASKIIFNRYPKLMAGDQLRLKLTTIESKALLSPTWVLRYSELFEDPRPYPNSYEISLEGKKYLRQVASEFSGLKAAKLAIYGFSDHDGKLSLNQAESYERALTIKQFLIAEAGFDRGRVEVFGMGELDLIIDDYRPGHSDINRRIEIKTLKTSPSPYSNRLRTEDLKHF